MEKLKDLISCIMAIIIYLICGSADEQSEQFDNDIHF